MFFVSVPPVFIHRTIFLGKDWEYYIYITNVVHLCFYQEMHHIGKGYYYWIIFLRGICWGIGGAGEGGEAHALSATHQGQ